MVNVEPVKGLTYYMDGKLQRSLEKKVKPTLKKKDEDYVVLIDGGERLGKSTFGMQLGKYVDPTLNLDRICFSPDEFRKAIINANQYQCVIYDEAYRGMGSAGALTEINRILKGLMMEMGQKNLFVIVILPTFYLLDRYVALFRARGLFHVFQSSRRKGYWRFFNKKNKQLLYMNPLGKKYFSYKHVKTGFKGRFYGAYAINEQEYRDKKAKSLKESYKTTRQEKYKEQRDRILYILYKKNKLSLTELSNLLKLNDVQLKKTILSNIIAKFKERP